MKQVNIQEAKAQLSHLLDRVAEGHTIIVARRNVPVAELRPVGGPGNKKRVIGLLRGRFEVPKSFLKPLPKGD